MNMIAIKSKREIEIMKKSCRLAAKTLLFIGPHVKAGVSTDELNNLCHEYIISNGAIPSPLNYHGFPKSICTSVNHVICHGIPREDEILKDSDIVNLDVTTYLNGFHGDTNKTFLVGNVAPKTRALVDTAFECMMAGIAEIKPGARLGNIGAAIQKIAHERGYSVVRDYCGHGIGREFHEDPQVLHFGDRNTGIEMKPGMVFTVEPMINMGDYRCKTLEDGWTVETIDGKLSAQFEHTVLVTPSGYEILTIAD